MNQIQSDIHVEGKSFSDHCFANLSSGQQSSYYHSSPAVSGFTDCFLIPSSCQNKGHPWPVTQVIGVEDSPDSDSDYDSSVTRLYENAEKVFRHQPIRLFSPWLSPVRQPNRALTFQPIGALLIWAFPQYFDTNIFTSYTRRNDTSTSKAARTIGSHTRASINELTRSSSTNLRFGFLPTLPAAPLHAIEPWEPRHSWPLTCRAVGHGRASDESRLRPWEVVWRNWPEIAEEKKKDISNDNFAAILAEFHPGFKDGNEFFMGTSIDIRETEKLYSAMIGAFEKAVVENRE
ncbi:hypothetical protein FOC1_g10008867 [Fusarium oxysporum f. sp. cubense race 1]|uniref:Uncharacterized protein n=1 Tax=Fusarium oxysporum f. sp. cubense (strain race 1) TaxID=1229664 RepID=N4UX97_FUSC1|nr:hypothetical protein FOC1_g10008867 [Fusarium oxysporum f. sp. cubense race 1]